MSSNHAYTKDKTMKERKYTMKFDMPNTSEYVSKDILDEDFVKSFRLLMYVQMALGACRVHCKDRFMTTPTLYQKIYTLLFLGFNLVLYVIILRIYSMKYRENIYVYYLITSGIVVDLIIYVCNIIHVRFFNGDANIDFFIHLQATDRLMKIEHNAVMVGMVRRLNNITFMCFITILVSFLGFVFIKGGLLNLSYSCILSSQLTSMLEVANCANFIVYFFNRLRFVTSIITNHLYPCKTNEPPKFYFRTIATKQCMRYTTAQTHDFLLSDTEKYLKAIFDGFKKFQDVYKFQVFTFCVKLVLLSLITFEFILFTVQSNLLKMVEIISVVMFSGINYSMALVLSVRYEIFFREVKKTKCLSIAILMQYQEGPLRQKAKRMLKMIEESPPNFSVYDMWYMDARIFLKIFSLITSLIVTLLQFAFL